MRKTIRHVAVLAAAVAMLTAIAVPAQSKGLPTPTIETFEVTCSGPHYVTAAATAEEDKWVRTLLIYVLARTATWPYLEMIDEDEAEGKGPLQVQVEGDVTGELGDGYYEVYARLTVSNGGGRSDTESAYGWC